MLDISHYDRLLNILIVKLLKIPNFMTGACQRRRGEKFTTFSTLASLLPKLVDNIPY